MDRLHIIRRCVTGRTVLDCGAADHYCFGHKLSRGVWLHAGVRAVAKSVVGVDILRDAVEQLNAAGYDFRVADVERMDLSERFDVVLTGDLIEHLANPGAFLQCAKRHLNRRG